jgi:hypothetical protein
MKSILKSSTIRIFSVTLALSAVALSQGASPQTSRDEREPKRACSNRSLVGDYGMQIEGRLLGPNLPLRTLVLIHFDGSGNLTSLSHVILNGKPPDEEWRPGTGTYTVHADCTGSALFDETISLSFIVVKRGRQFIGVVNGDAITTVGYKTD